MSFSESSLAIVTGGASGIGLAVTRRILSEGHPVAVCDVDRNALEALEGEPDYGSLLTAHALDVTDEAAVEETVEKIVGSGPPLSGLVNSAGIGRVVPVLDTEVSMFRQILDINLVGSFAVARAAARRMERGGSIVNIASVSGMAGSVDRVAYGSSKAGVINMTQVMATELAALGIRVNAVAPGPVDTPMTRAMHDDEARQAWHERVPMRRYGTVEEIASAVWFLLSSEAGYITGHCLPVDGGYIMAGLMRPVREV